LRIQEDVRDQVAQATAVDTLLLLEHEAVITLGRSADLANVIASAEDLGRAGITVVRTSRGGDVTYHGPGQLVGYPVFRLRRGVRAHVKAMADGIIAALATFGIAAEWQASRPGVWVGAEKICAVGVHVRRRVAMHGFALNVTTDLSAFRTIVPCGLRDAGVTSMERLLGTALELEDVAERLVRAFERSFLLRLKRISASSSRLQIANGAGRASQSSTIATSREPKRIPRTRRVRTSKTSRRTFFAS
jgi:lipoyl(octanoyl) transferase